MLDIPIKQSNCGYYGTDGEYKDHNLPINEKCPCGSSGILLTKYDDTAGFRETTYLLKCDKCNIKAGGGSEMQNTIADWDERCKIAKSLPETLPNLLEIEDISPEQARRMLKALVKQICDDMTVMYAPDECGQEAVKEMRKRIRKNHSTLVYISRREILANLLIDKISIKLNGLP